MGLKQSMALKGTTHLWKIVIFLFANNLIWLAVWSLDIATGHEIVMNLEYNDSCTFQRLTFD